jgi:pyruvate formate lyase activating enzyme
MKIGGFQKTSLLDYPDNISAIIWTVGCNFRCPFCYNKNIVEGNVELIPEEEILSFLKKRKGMLDGLVISGGEPLMQDDIKDFIKKVKELGFLVKIDTNGMYPKKLKELLDDKLVDYIAMDVKAPKEKYGKLTGNKSDLKKIDQSIKIIMNIAPDYEFKTTFVPGLLKKEDIVEIGKWLKGSRKYYLQKFKNDVPLLSSELAKTNPYPKEEFLETINRIKSYFKKCDVRGL